MFKHLAVFFLLLFLAAPALAEEVSTPYYTVAVPEGWKHFPDDGAQGVASAIFAKSVGGASVTIVAAPAGGKDVKTIAALFAEQLKAEKAPEEKDGRYVFNFQNQNVSCQIWVAVQDDIFMTVSLAGNVKDGLEFLKKNVKSQRYPQLLPN